MKDELKAMLEKLADRECWSDDEDFIAYEYAGGNFDDAYAGGVEDGEAILARIILNKLKELNQP